MGTLRVRHELWVGHKLSDFTFSFHFHALEEEMATHSSVLAWRIPGMGEPGGLPSMGSHRVGHDWSDLAAAAAAAAAASNLDNWIFTLTILNYQARWSSLPDSRWAKLYSRNLGPLELPAPVPTGILSQRHSVLPLASLSDLLLAQWILSNLLLWDDWKSSTYFSTWNSFVRVAQSSPTLCDPMDCSLPGSSVHGILQTRILEWVAISFSRGSSQPRDQSQVSCIEGRCFNLWATREALLSETPAAAKSLQSCLILCDPINGSPPGSAIPGILYARTLEWVAISFSMSETEC